MSDKDLKLVDQINLSSLIEVEITTNYILNNQSDSSASSVTKSRFLTNKWVSISKMLDGKLIVIIIWSDEVKFSWFLGQIKELMGDQDCLTDPIRKSIRTSKIDSIMGIEKFLH